YFARRHAGNRLDQLDDARHLVSGQAFHAPEPDIPLLDRRLCDDQRLHRFAPYAVPRLDDDRLANAPHPADYGFYLSGCHEQTADIDQVVDPPDQLQAARTGIDITEIACRRFACLRCAVRGTNDDLALLRPPPLRIRSSRPNQDFVMAERPADIVRRLRPACDRDAARLRTAILLPHLMT